MLFECLPRILRRILSVTLSSSLERKSAALLIEPAICAILKLNCNTVSHALHSTGRIAFVLLNRLTALFFVRRSVAFEFKKCHVKCQNFFRVDGHLEFCRGNDFRSERYRAHVLRFQCIFRSVLSSVMGAYPAPLKLASVIRTNCFPGRVFLVPTHKHH